MVLGSWVGVVEWEMVSGGGLWGVSFREGLVEGSYSLLGRMETGRVGALKEM